jgi:hypothetical protein
MWHAWERGETCTGFWGEGPKEKDHLEDQDVDGCDQTGPEGDWLGGGVEWIHLVQDKDSLRAVVNAVMNLRIMAPRS